MGNITAFDGGKAEENTLCDTHLWDIFLGLQF